MEMDKLYQHNVFDKQAQDLWEHQGIYAFKPTDPAKVFSIDTPPPTVSGTLHIGHVFSYTHADLVARYQRMSGFHVFYPMGFDDNGLATERFVEKKNNTKAYLMPRSEFIALCLRETMAAEKQFEALWRGLALSIDWSKLYSTISEPVRRASQYSFIELYKKGLVYRKQEPSLYCTTCRTSVAQAELESSEVSTMFNNIIFTTEGGEKLTIATTRPELLPACVAVFFHPDDTRYKHLAGKFAITPVFEKPVRIMPDDKVDPAKGTGLVMCCTFGDQTDIYWYKTYKLPFEHIVGLDGKWTEASGPLVGLTMRDARKKVLELLTQANALVDQKSITHSVNTHERCKQEIEYLILSQWFINILDHKETLLKRADEIEWRPEFMKVRYQDWVQNLHWDWCISRQRFFGIPFPVWHCKDCSHIIVADAKMLPIDPQEQSYPGGKCSECSGTHLTPDTDVMDTWNTSSITPLINIKWPDGSADKLVLPMSLRPQAHDIIRTWAFYTIVKAHYHANTIPWKTIMISGHVLAGKEKISKSQGNAKMAPEELLKNYPADVIRYWAASGRLGTDTAFSENQLKIGQRLVTKLWNAFRFIAEHLKNRAAVKVVVNDPLNQWILHSFSQTHAAYHQCFKGYEYYAALETGEKFFWADFCDNYLELIKDRLFNTQNYDPALIAETQFVLYEIGFGLLQMFAPFVPHVTETLYQLLFKDKEGVVSLHATTFDAKRCAYSFDRSNELMQRILMVVGAVRKLKSEGQHSLKAELITLEICSADKAVIADLETQKNLLKGIANAREIVYKTTAASTELQQTPQGLIARVGL